MDGDAQLSRAPSQPCIRLALARTQQVHSKMAVHHAQLCPHLTWGDQGREVMCHVTQAEPRLKKWPVHLTWQMMELNLTEKGQSAPMEVGTGRDQQA